MTEQNGPAVAVGCQVRIRPIGWSEPRSLLTGIEADSGDRVVMIAAAGDGGPYRLTPRTPLGRALLGHHAGDVIRVAVQAATVEYAILAVQRVAPTSLPLRQVGAETHCLSLRSRGWDGHDRPTLQSTVHAGGGSNP